MTVATRVQYGPEGTTLEGTKTGGDIGFLKEALYLLLLKIIYWTTIVMGIWVGLDNISQFVCTDYRISLLIYMLQAFGIFI